MTSQHSISDTLVSNSLLQGNEVIHYEGKIDQEINDNLIERVDALVSSEVFEMSVGRKMFNVSVEAIQNLFHFSNREDVPADKKEILFVISESDAEVTVTTANMMCQASTNAISSRINMINSFSKEELRDFYRGVLDTGRVSEQGGAGLGLIDIARKSNQQLDYHFIDIDDQCCFFVLKINVSK